MRLGGALVAADGDQNLRMIALKETEHIRVEKENRHGSFGLADGRAFLTFPLRAIGLDGRQPCVEQRIFR
jgi:hypothetical protein